MATPASLRGPRLIPSWRAISASEIRSPGLNSPVTIASMILLSASLAIVDGWVIGSSTGVDGPGCLILSIGAC